MRQRMVLISILAAILAFAFVSFAAAAGIDQASSEGTVATDGTAVPVGNPKSLQITLAQYVDAYIAGSDTMKSAQDKLDSAVDSYERAVAEKKAALSVVELKDAVDTARLALAEAKNSVAIQAIQTYLTYAQTLRDTEIKRAALPVAKEQLRVVSLRYEAGLSTKDTVLQQQNSYIQAMDALVKAEQTLKDATASFCKDIGVDPYDEVVLLTDTGALYTGTPDYKLEDCVQSALAASSSYLSATRARDLAQRKYEALKDPMVATANERSQAQDTLTSAIEKVADTEASVRSSVESGLAQIDSLVRSLEMQQLSMELADNSLEVAKISANHGEMLQYELDSQVNSHASSESKLIKAKEDLYLQIVKVMSLLGNDVAAEIAKAQ